MAKLHISMQPQQLHAHSHGMVHSVPCPHKQPPHMPHHVCSVAHGCPVLSHSLCITTLLLLCCSQLLFNIEFQQKVKLQAIMIKGPADSGPKVVKLFVNRCVRGSRHC